ncbi:hypothetical protein P8452_13697 [Trifolium repens]|nr:hypothetical protein P8452_13697 [Trifolium repens]
MATWEDINELSEDEDSEEANLALMATDRSRHYHRTFIDSENICIGTRTTFNHVFISGLPHKIKKATSEMCPWHSKQRP